MKLSRRLSLILPGLALMLAVFFAFACQRVESPHSRSPKIPAESTLPQHSNTAPPIDMQPLSMPQPPPPVRAIDESLYAPLDYDPTSKRPANRSMKKPNGTQPQSTIARSQRPLDRRQAPAVKNPGRTNLRVPGVSAPMRQPPVTYWQAYPTNPSMQPPAAPAPAYGYYPPSMQSYRPAPPPGHAFPYFAPQEPAYR